MARVSLRVNGTSRVVDVDPTTPLLYVLRNDLGLDVLVVAFGERQGEKK